MRESDIEKYLVKRVKEMGGEVRKVKWIGREGAPDRLVMLPERLRKGEPVPSPIGTFLPLIPTPGQTLWIELKKPGGKAKFPSNPHERKQAREHKRMQAMGQRVEVIDSFEGVDEVLR